MFHQKKAVVSVQRLEQSNIPQQKELDAPLMIFPTVLIRYYQCFIQRGGGQGHLAPRRLTSPSRELQFLRLILYICPPENRTSPPPPPPPENVFALSEEKTWIKHWILFT